MIEDKEKISIVIADNHALYRQKIEEVISGTGKNMEVVGEIDSRFKLAGIIEEKVPNLLLIDMNFVLDVNLRTIKSLKAQHETLKVLVLSDNLDPAYQELAFLAGASNICLKENIAYDLVPLIESIFNEAGPD